MNYYVTLWPAFWVIVALIVMIGWWASRRKPDIVTIVEWDSAQTAWKYACYCYERDEATGKCLHVYGYGVSDQSEAEARGMGMDRLDAAKRGLASLPKIEVIRR